MAKFRDSVADTTIVEAAAQRQGAMPPPHAAEDSTSHAPERSIGDILAELRNLSAEQVERVLQHQRSTDMRFGEAAVALGMATKDDVLFALAKQFNYPYAPEASRKVGDELVTMHEPFGPRAEHFRALRSQLMMRLYPEGEPRRALAIISPDSGDGKTYCAANLAVVLAQLGGRTLVVDADMRGPRLHEVFNVSNRSGLTGILTGRSDAQVIQQVAGVPSLFVLPLGTTPPNPAELVERQAFGLLMRELCAKFDHVVVDTPAAVHGSDAAVIAARCGTALVVARQNRSRVGQLQELLSSFSGSHARLAGVVVNEF